MDVVHALKLYIQRMIDEAGHGIKALLMDKETVSLFLFLNQISFNCKNFLAD